jgi:GntR family transcriptional repressor for pyruvate dehydrogenase complex
MVLLINLKDSSSKEAVVKKVVQYIKKEIITGKLKPGDKILPERQIAEKAGVSRSSVREALKVFSVYGIIERKCGQGSFINENTNLSVLADFFGLAFILNPFSKEHIREVRTIFECEAAYLAATRASEKDLVKIKEALCEMENSKNLGADSDYAFHRQIVNSAHNEALVFIYNAIDDILRQHHYDQRKKLFSEKPGSYLALVKIHEDIYKSLELRNADKTRELMKEHFIFTGG